jgi:hypothetical protein
MVRLDQAFTIGLHKWYDYVDETQTAAGTPYR